MHRKPRTPEETYALALQKAQLEVAHLEPRRTADRAAVTYEIGSGSGGSFEVTLLGKDYRVQWPEGIVEEVNDGPEPDIAGRILVLHYLLTATGTPQKDQWIAFRNLPGGLGYDTAFQQRVNRRLAHAFGRNLGAFETAALELGGERLSFGNASFAFRVLPRVCLAVVLNLADEEFPANANVLFDAVASHYLPTEDLAVLGGMLAGRLLKAAQGK